LKLESQKLDKLLSFQELLELLEVLPDKSLKIASELLLSDPLEEKIRLNIYKKSDMTMLLTTNLKI